MMKNVLFLTVTLASSLAVASAVFAQSKTNSLKTPVATPASQKNNNTASEIKQLENELARAVVARDYTLIQRIEADDYVYTDSDAVVTTRDEFIREYKAGSSQVSALRFEEMTVDAYDNAAVVRGIVTVDRTTNGVKISRVSRYTRFYIRFPAGWRAVAGHSSKLDRPLH